MAQTLKQNGLRFVLTNLGFALICYTCFVNVNSAVPGSVDKVDAAIRISGIFLVILNLAFLITFGISAFVPKLKQSLVLRMVTETVLILGLSGILILLNPNF